MQRAQDEGRDEIIQPVRKLSKQQLQQQEEALYDEPDPGAISPVREPSYVGEDEPPWESSTGPQEEPLTTRVKENGGGAGRNLDDLYIAHTKEANEIFGRL